jgi:hypothetical protein
LDTPVPSLYIGVTLGGSVFVEQLVSLPSPAITVITIMIRTHGK